MRGFRTWLAAAAVLVLAGIVVPYGLLGGGTPSPDIFVFWCGFGLAVVALIALGVARWRL